MYQLSDISFTIVDMNFDINFRFDFQLSEKSFYEIELVTSVDLKYPTVFSPHK
jgi:hypothetical protein